jgi:hypothetical protein
LLFILFANDGLADMKALHSGLRPGMHYREVVSSASNVPRAGWSCLGGAKDAMPPCETLLLYTSGDQGSLWSARIRFNAAGIVVSISPIECAD